MSLTFGAYPVPGTDSRPLFHFSYYYGIGDFRRFIRIFHATTGRFVRYLAKSRRQDNELNTFGSDPADIRIRINQDIRIRIPDMILASAEFALSVCSCMYRSPADPCAWKTKDPTSWSLVVPKFTKNIANLYF